MGWFIPQSSSSWLPRQIGPLPTRVWCHLRQPDASSLHSGLHSYGPTPFDVCFLASYSRREGLFSGTCFVRPHTCSISGRTVAARLFSELPRRVLLGNPQLSETRIPRSVTLA